MPAVNFRYILTVSSLSRIYVLSRHSKQTQKIRFQDRLSLNAGKKYCRMLQWEHSAILLTFIKLPFVIKTFVLSIFDWPLKTGFTVHVFEFAVVGVLRILNRITKHFFYFSKPEQSLEDNLFSWNQKYIVHVHAGFGHKLLNAFIIVLLP